MVIDTKYPASPKRCADVLVKIQKHEKNFSLIDNKLARDKRLSFAARGVMLYLLSHDNNWTVRLNDLVRQSPAGRRAIKSIFNELRSLGYARLEICHDANGKLSGKTWRIFEVPRRCSFATVVQRDRRAKAPYKKIDLYQRRNGTSSLSKENQSATTIPSDFRPIADRYNDTLAVKDWYRAERLTPRLARALERCGNDRRSLFQLFDAISEGRVNGYAPSPRQRNLTSLLHSYANGKVKITPKRYTSVDEQRQSRRAKETA